MPIEQQIPSDYEQVAKELELQKDEAYVHVGDGSDDMLRYLSRVDGDDSVYAVIIKNGAATLLVSGTYIDEAHRNFPGNDVIELHGDTSLETEVEKLVTDSLVSVKVPETMDAAHYLAFSEFADVDVVDVPIRARTRKYDAERERLERVERGAQSAMARAETVLAESVIDGNELYWNGEVLTTDLLRGEIQKVMADWGLGGGSGSIVGAGPTCAELHFTGYDTIRPDETVLIDLAPRGPQGYYGDITRTFVRGTPSPWAEETYDIVREALDAAFEVLENGAGTPFNGTYEAIVDVIESYGYGTGDVNVGLTHGTGHGVGLSVHEPPFSKGDADLEAGNVVTIEPGVYDPDRGGVRLEDFVVITEDGYENLVDYPYEIQPSKREQPPWFLVEET